MKKIMLYITAAIISLAGSAQATIMEGYSSGSTIIDNGGGSWTYIFDLGGGANERTNTDGLFFQFGSSSTLNVTGSGAVNHDLSPGNGGLGVMGGDTGDNLSTGEWLRFDFGGLSFDLDSILFNNGCGNGHQEKFTDDCILGDFRDRAKVTGSNGVVHSDSARALDSINDSRWKDDHFSDIGGMIDLTYFDVAEHSNKRQFSGYVEAIRITLNDVPEPSVIALFGVGLFGIGLARRRRS